MSSEGELFARLIHHRETWLSGSRLEAGDVVVTFRVTDLEE